MPMTTTLLAISAAYVVLAVIVLSMGLSSRYAWWLKAGAIVITSGFFVEVFFASKGLLGWPAGAGGLPPKFQLLWTRVVEPDPKVGDRGAIFLWVEEVDANNVPSGTPRAFRLPYSVKLADRTLKARDEIMSGNPQEGLADDLAGGDEQANPNASSLTANLQQPDGGTTSTGGKVELQGSLEGVPHVEFRPMSNPLLPPKP
jgi:hypothetical protein